MAEQLTPELLRRIGEALHGPEWHRPLARDLAVNDQTVRRWLAGRFTIPPGVLDDLERLVAESRSLAHQQWVNLTVVASELALLREG